MCTSWCEISKIRGGGMELKGDTESDQKGERGKKTTKLVEESQFVRENKKQTTTEKHKDSKKIRLTSL